MEFEHIDEILQMKGMYVGGFEGDSMMPILRQGIDSVILKSPQRKLKKYDLVLYKRGNRYVLHRIVKVCGNGKYIIRGDNRLHNETDITDENIIGVMDSFFRGKDLIEVTNKKYIRYVKHTVRAYYPKKLLYLFKTALRKIVLGKSRNGVQS